jgi:hypothetical protein
MSKLAEQFDAAAEVSRQAFAAGDVVTGIAAIKLAAQLVQIIRLLEPDPPAPAKRFDDEEKR